MVMVMTMMTMMTTNMKMKMMMMMMRRRRKRRKRNWILVRPMFGETLVHLWYVVCRLSEFLGLLPSRASAELLLQF